MVTSFSADVSPWRIFLTSPDGLGKRRIFLGVRQYRIAKYPGRGAALLALLR
jgi:hypothetical protein